MPTNGASTEDTTQTPNNLPEPALRAAYRLAQLYRGTGRDGALLVHCWLIDGRLKLVVNGRAEDLGRWEAEQ